MWSLFWVIWVRAGTQRGIIFGSRSGMFEAVGATPVPIRISVNGLSAISSLATISCCLWSSSHPKSASLLARAHSCFHHDHGTRGRQYSRRPHNGACHARIILLSTNFAILVIITCVSGRYRRIFDRSSRSCRRICRVPVAPEHSIHTFPCQIDHSRTLIVKGTVSMVRSCCRTPRQHGRNRYRTFFVW